MCLVINIPWWLPHAYNQAKEEGFKGTMSDFLNDFVLEFIDRIGKEGE